MRGLFQTTAVVGALMASAAMAQTPPATPTPATPGANMPAAPANAPAPTSPAPTGGQRVTAGAEVRGPQGNVVGTIEDVDAQYATLATPNAKVRLPITAFAVHPTGLVIGMTQAQLEQAAGTAGAAAASADQNAPGMTPNAMTNAAQGTPGAASTPGASTDAAASGSPSLTTGATVSDTNGGRVGTIEEVSGDFAVVATAKNKVRLPLTAFANGANGPIIGMTEAQLDAAAEAAKPASAAR